jgi:DNA helicase-2/ATP-dependent DNA helicase PcrA
MDLLAHLNPEQRAAVTLPPGHALILAGAGSGKTRVLTTRIAWLISTGQASPAAFLAVTFTNKAAREMMARLSVMLPIDPRRMWIGTFHGLCHRMLRIHHRDAALPPSFQILDTQDQFAVVKRVLKAMEVDDQQFPPRNVQYFIAGSKEQGLRPAAVDIPDDHTARLVEIYRAYEDACQREGSVDFAELLLRSYELLERNEPLRNHYGERFRHILVDEFQDTNDLQYRWLKQLAGAATGLFAVGDDDQSIYSFRGANVANMAAFEREFAHDRVIKLEQNYRSHAHILDAANALIRQNVRRLGKELWTDAGEGEPIRVYEAMADGEEAQWLLEEIRSLIGEGARRSEVAVLYRSNAQSRVIEHAMFSAGIPYKVYGGLRFFERAEVKHAIAYLRLVENPADDSAFLRVVNFPARGIGARTIEQLQDSARRDGIGLIAAVPRLAGTAVRRLEGFVALLDRMRREVRQLPLDEAVKVVVELSGLIAHYRTEREGQDRIENLHELVNAAATFAAEAGGDILTPAEMGLVALPVAGVDTVSEATATGNTAGAAESGSVEGDVVATETERAEAVQRAEAVRRVESLEADAVLEAGPGAPGPAVTPLAGFLAHASLESGEGQAADGVDSVQLMTVHSAKGLEFDTVFITGLEEGLFPHENSVTAVDGLEEERRLMYVAITRARKRLYLSFAQTRMLHGQTRYNVRSRFLSELPGPSLKWLTSAAGRSPSWASASQHYSRGTTPWSAPTRPSTALLAHRISRDSRFRIGQSVGHPRFGEGVIIGMEGGGADVRVQVNFGRQGTKWLALSIAKLEPVN